MSAVVDDPEVQKCLRVIERATDPAPMSQREYEMYQRCLSSPVAVPMPERLVRAGEELMQRLKKQSGPEPLDDVGE